MAAKKQDGVVEAEVVNAKPAEAKPVEYEVAGKTARNETILVPKGFDTSGFVTEATKSDDWAKVQTDRRMYRMDFCARFGGVRGYLLKTEIMKSPKAVNPKNPEGLFTAAIVRLTAPAPVCNDRGELSRAEAGEDVLVVVTYALTELKSFDVDPVYCAEIEIVPSAKETISNGHNLWRATLHVNLDKIPRKQVDAAAMLFAPADMDRLLGEGSPASSTPTPQAAAASSAS